MLYQKIVYLQQFSMIPTRRRELETAKRLWAKLDPELRFVVSNQLPITFAENTNATKQ